MNEAEARVLRDIIQGTIRETIAAELRPIYESLTPLYGVPQTIRDLIEKWIDLDATLKQLKPAVEEHKGEIVSLRRELREMAPKLERCSILLNQLIPRIERALNLIDVNKEAAEAADAELRDSLTELEERRSASP